MSRHIALLKAKPARPPLTLCVICLPAGRAKELWGNVGPGEGKRGAGRVGGQHHAEFIRALQNHEGVRKLNGRQCHNNRDDFA